MLGLCPFWHRAPKTLGTSYVIGAIKMSFVVSQVTLGSA